MRGIWLRKRIQKENERNLVEEARIQKENERNLVEEEDTEGKWEEFG